MAKLDTSSAPIAPPQPPPADSVIVRRAMQRDADSGVPFDQAIRGAGFITLAVIAVVGLALLALNVPITERLLLFLFFGLLLIFGGIAARIFFVRLQVADRGQIEREEKRLGVDLNGDGQIGKEPRIIPVNLWRKPQPQRVNSADAEHALMLKFVDTLYTTGVTYNALRGKGFGNDTEIAKRLETLAAPEWGIIRFEQGRNGGRKVVLAVPHAEARKRVETAVRLDA